MGTLYVPGLPNGSRFDFTTPGIARYRGSGAGHAKCCRRPPPHHLQTANGSVAGRVVSGVTVAIGSQMVTNVRVGGPVWAR
jgi:hypothetical protein